MGWWDIQEVDESIFDYPDYNDRVGGFDEDGFMRWYSGWASKTGLSPDPDDPRHHYDYRKAYSVGAEPEIAEDGMWHWPSEFKAQDHPNRYVDGQDTITGMDARTQGPKDIGFDLSNYYTPQEVDESIFDYPDVVDEPISAREPAQTENEGSFVGNAFSRGIDQYQAGLYGAAGLAGRAIGLDALEDWGTEGYVRNIKEAEQTPGMSLKDVEGPVDFAKWGAEKVIEQAPLILSTILTAGAAGAAAGSSKVLGSTIVKKAMNGVLKKQVAKNMKNAAVKGIAKDKINDWAVKKTLQGLAGKAAVVESTAALESGHMFGEGAVKGQYNVGADIALGTLAGLVEIAGGNIRILDAVLGTKKAGMFGNAIGKIKKAIRFGKKPKAKDVGLFGRMLNEGISQAPAEFGQEAAQEVLSITSELIKDPEMKSFEQGVDKLTSPEKAWQIFESGVAGAVVGGGLGTVFGGAQAIGDKKADIPPETNNRAQVLSEFIDEYEKGNTGLGENAFDTLVATRNSKLLNDLAGVDPEVAAQLDRMDEIIRTTQAERSATPPPEGDRGTATPPPSGGVGLEGISDDSLINMADSGVGDAPLSRFLKNDHELLRNAGLVYRDENGSEQVSTDALWKERERRFQESKQGRGNVSDEEINKNVENRAAFRDRLAEEQEKLGDLGDQEAAKRYRKEAEEIRRGKRGAEPETPVEDRPEGIQKMADLLSKESDERLQELLSDDEIRPHAQAEIDRRAKGEAGVTPEEVDLEVSESGSKVVSLDDIIKKWGAQGVKVEAFEDKNGIKLDTMVVPPAERNQGIGTAVVADLKEYADDTGQKIRLSQAVKDDKIGTTSRSRLTKFYKGLGFVENRGKNKDFSIRESMYREPAQAESEDVSSFEMADVAIADSLGLSPMRLGGVKTESLRKEIVEMTKKVDEAYESGDLKTAEDIDAKLETKKEELDSILSEIEEGEIESDDEVDVVEDIAKRYHDSVVDKNSQYYSEDINEAADFIRGAFNEYPGANADDLTNDEILRLADDAYYAYRGRRNQPDLEVTHTEATPTKKDKAKVLNIPQKKLESEFDALVKIPAKDITPEQAKRRRALAGEVLRREERSEEKAQGERKKRQIKAMATPFLDGVKGVELKVMNTNEMTNATRSRVKEMVVGKAKRRFADGINAIRTENGLNVLKIKDSSTVAQLKKAYVSTMTEIAKNNGRKVTNKDIAELNKIFDTAYKEQTNTRGVKVKGQFISKVDKKTGAVVGGTWTIFADNITSMDQIEQNALHEVLGGHAAIQMMFGKEYDSKMDELYKLLTPKQKKEVDRYAVQYDRATIDEDGNVVYKSDDRFDADYNRRKSTEEFLAYRAGKGDKSTAVQKFIAWVREFLRKAFPNLKVTDAEIRRLISQAREFVVASELRRGVEGKIDLEAGHESRVDAVKEAKALGLPATGKTVDIAERVRIAKAPASTWSMDEFKKILPHLSIHQIYPRGSDTNESIIEAVAENGLTRGMVDNLGSFADKDHWSWATKIDKPSVVLLSGELKYASKDSPSIRGSGKPVAVIRPKAPIKKGDIQALYKAVTAKKNSEGIPDLQVDAWHGSPHDITKSLEGKFSTKYIGTGEGAQAFGWGLYFTSKKNIAAGYATSLAGKPEPVFGWKIGKNILRESDTDYSAVYNNFANGVSKDAVVQSYVDYRDAMKSAVPIGNTPDSHRLQAIKWAEEAIKLAKSINEPVSFWQDERTENRNLYKVTLHKGKSTDDYVWLDWDEQLTVDARTMVMEQLQNEGEWFTGAAIKEAEQAVRDSDWGDQLYTDLSFALGSDKEASQFLLRAGIDGIRYPTGTLSGGKQDGFNYVVFDDSAITIEDHKVFEFAVDRKPLDKAIEEVKKNPKFKKWFKGSRVVDEDGTPTVNYHGTTRQFSIFGGEGGLSSLGYHYFSDSPNFAEKFAYSDKPIRDGALRPKKVKMAMPEGVVERDGYSTEIPGLVVVVDGGYISLTHEQSGYALSKGLESLDEAIDVIDALKNVRVRWDVPAEKIAKFSNRTKKMIANAISDGRGAEVAAMFGYKANAKGYGAGSSVMPVLLDIKNPLDLTSIKARNIHPNTLKKVLVANGIELDKGAYFWSGRDLYQVLNQEDIASGIRKEALKLGFDGIKFNDYFDAKTKGVSHIAFHSNQIKSVFNRGTFSEESDDIMLEASIEKDVDIFDGTEYALGKSRPSGLKNVEVSSQDEQSKTGRSLGAPVYPAPSWNKKNTEHHIEFAVEIIDDSAFSEFMRIATAMVTRGFGAGKKTDIVYTNRKFGKFGTDKHDALSLKAHRDLLSGVPPEVRTGQIDFKKSGNNKLKGQPMVQISSGCGRNAAILSAIKAGVMPADMVKDMVSCHGSCYKNFDQGAQTGGNIFSTFMNAARRGLKKNDPKVARDMVMFFNKALGTKLTISDLVAVKDLDKYPKRFTKNIGRVVGEYRKANVTPALYKARDKFNALGVDRKSEIWEDLEKKFPTMVRDWVPQEVQTVIVPTPEEVARRVWGMSEGVFLDIINAPSDFIRGNQQGDWLQELVLEKDGVTTWEAYAEAMLSRYEKVTGNSRESFPKRLSVVTAGWYVDVPFKTLERVANKYGDYILVQATGPIDFTEEEAVLRLRGFKKLHDAGLTPVLRLITDEFGVGGGNLNHKKAIEKTLKFIIDNGIRPDQVLETPLHYDSARLGRTKVGENEAKRMDDLVSKGVDQQNAFQEVMGKKLESLTIGIKELWAVPTEEAESLGRKVLTRNTVFHRTDKRMPIDAQKVGHSEVGLTYARLKELGVPAAITKKLRGMGYIHKFSRGGLKQEGVFPNMCCTTGKCVTCDSQCLARYMNDIVAGRREHAISIINTLHADDAANLINLGLNQKEQMKMVAPRMPKGVDADYEFSFGDRQSPERIAKILNRQIPGHDIAFDGVWRMPEEVDSQNLYQFTPQAGPFVGRTFTVEDPTVDAIKDKLIEMDDTPADLEVEMTDVWYSQMQRVLERKLPKQAPVKNMAQTIKAWAKKGEFKTEELEWSGVEDWLSQKNGKVTKAEIIDYLRENNVRVEEVVKGRQGMSATDKKRLLLGSPLTERDYKGWGKQLFDHKAIPVYQYWFNNDLYEGTIIEFDDGKYALIDEGDDIANYNTLDEALDAVELSERDESSMFTQGGSERLSAVMRMHPAAVKILEDSGITPDYGPDEFAPMLGFVDNEGDIITEIGEMEADPYYSDDVIAAANVIYDAYYAEDNPASATQFGPDSEYNVVTPGGENYKELLLTLPVRGSNLAERKKLEQKVLQQKEILRQAFSYESSKGTESATNRRMEAETKLTELENELDSLGGKLPEQYTKGHWDEPNVLVHARFDERTDSKGRRVLHVAEVQSDWHQEGRKKGYAGKFKAYVSLLNHETGRIERIGEETDGPDLPEFDTEEEAWKSITGISKSNKTKEEFIKKYIVTDITSIADSVDDFIIGFEDKRGVPNAPFKQSREWGLLAMKRMVRWAAENGFDAITWDDGIVQADRYDLSTHINKLYYAKVDGGYKLWADVVGGRPEDFGFHKTEDLDGVVGKDVAEKITNGEGLQAGIKVASESSPGILSGLDLKVGGEGMKGFYDKILPNTLNGFFNKAKWGKAKVGVAEIKKWTIPGESLRDVRELENGVIEYWSEDTSEPSMSIIPLDSGQFMVFDVHGGGDLGVFNTVRESKEFVEFMFKERGPEQIGIAKVWSLPITPEMKDKALTEGMPMFEVDQGFKKDLLNKLKGIDNITTESIEEDVQNGIDGKKKSSMKPPVFGSEFDATKDSWFAEKDWQTHYNSVQARLIQENIRKAVGEKRFGKKSQDMDAAIHIFLDLKRNPSHAEEYYDALPKEIQRIVDIAQTIPKNAKILKVAEYIERQYEELGSRAKASDVIHNVIENYVGRAWEVPKDKKGNALSTDVLQKFKTTSRHAKMRVFETILQGYATPGYKLKVTGASNNLNLVKDEIARTIEDKRLISRLLKAKDENGNKVLSSKQESPDYVQINHPNFTHSVVRMDIKNSEETKKFGGDFWVDTKYGAIPEGKKRAKKLFDTREDAEKWIAEQDGEFMIRKRETVMQKTPLYAPAEIAKRLNKILDSSALRGKLRVGGVSVIDVLTKYNAVFKSTILATSFFHHIAFMNSYLLGTRHKTAGEWRFMKAYKEGLDAVNSLNPVVELLVRNGLTLGRMQDWEESILRSEDTIFGRAIDRFSDKVGIESPRKFKDWVNGLRERQANFLFQKFGAGLKVKAALIEYKNALKEHPDMDPNERAKMVASLINDDFGGLHHQRMERSQTGQHIFRLFALAPDWTESNIRSMYKVFLKGGPDGTKDIKAQKEVYRRFWASVITKGLTATILANLALSAGDDDDFWERYKKAWDEGHLRWLDVDITPIYKALGGETNARKYFTLIGHFKDPFKFVTAPVRSAHHKGSVLYSTVYELMSGKDWKGQRFTTFPEMFGFDDKGVYVTSKKGKYKAGDPKGGKLKWQLTTYKAGGSGGSPDYSQLPSYVLSQLRGLTPVQIQNLLARMAGEAEWFETIAKSVGLKVSSTYPNKRRDLNRFSQRYVDSLGKNTKDLMADVKRYNALADEDEQIKWASVKKKGDKMLAIRNRALRQFAQKYNDVSQSVLDKEIKAYNSGKPDALRITMDMVRRVAGRKAVKTFEPYTFEPRKTMSVRDAINLIQ
jgi:GNAT superfamily N-acetyltransferase